MLVSSANMKNNQAMNDILTYHDQLFYSSTSNNNLNTIQMEEKQMDNNMQNNDMSIEADAVIVYELLSMFSILRVQKKINNTNPMIITTNSFAPSKLLIQTLSQYLDKLNFNANAKTNNEALITIFNNHTNIDYAFINAVDKNILMDELVNIHNKLHWTIYAKPNTEIEFNEAVTFLYDIFSLLYQQEFNKPFYIEQTNDIIIEYYLNIGFTCMPL